MSNEDFTPPKLESMREADQNIEAAQRTVLSLSKVINKCLSEEGIEDPEARDLFEVVQATLERVCIQLDCAKGHMGWTPLAGNFLPEPR